MQISMEQLNMAYPNGKQALRSVSAELRSPSLIGLLGPNGAGKSTLMKLLVAGLLPTGGSITVDGVPLAKAERSLKSRLGYLPQHFGLYDDLTVRQFLDYMAALKDMENRKSSIGEVLEAVHLTDNGGAKIRTLSGGQRQRVGIAQALLGAPELLIFDEPTVGLDPEERIHFRNLFSQMARDKLVLLSTHIIEDVQSVCDRLLVIHHGQLLFDGTPEALIAQAQSHVCTYHEGDVAADALGLHTTARVNTASGVLCRGVAKALPAGVREAEPTLEDAYLYLITGEGDGQ